MIKLLSSGGLGDTVMVYAKIYGLIEWPGVSLTHVVSHNHYCDSIKEFYYSQGLEVECYCLENKRQWIDDNIDNYDFFVSTGYRADELLGTFIDRGKIYGSLLTIGVKNNIEFNYKKKKVDTLIAPVSGYPRRVKSFNLDDVVCYVNGHDNVVVVGKMDKRWGNTLKNAIDGEHYINDSNFSIKDLVDYVCSANEVIAPEGFVSYLGAVAGKRVKILDKNRSAIDKKINPEWSNVKLVNRL